MRTKKQWPTATTMGPESNLHVGTYHNSKAASRAKLHMGKILLMLQSPLSQDQQRKYWHHFESLLWKYMDLRCCEVA